MKNLHTFMIIDNIFLSIIMIFIVVNIYELNNIFKNDKVKYSYISNAGEPEEEVKDVDQHLYNFYKDRNRLKILFENQTLDFDYKNYNNYVKYIIPISVTILVIYIIKIIIIYFNYLKLNFILEIFNLALIITIFIYNFKLKDMKDMIKSIYNYFMYNVAIAPEPKIKNKNNFALTNFSNQLKKSTDVTLYSCIIIITYFILFSRSSLYLYLI